MPEIESAGGKKVKKPSTLLDYNGAKGYVDLSDQSSSYSNTLRKGVKWYRKVAFDLLTNVVTVNSHRLYKMVTQHKITITAFREAIVLSSLHNRRAFVEIAATPPQQCLRKHKTRPVHMLLRDTFKARG